MVQKLGEFRFKKMVNDYNDAKANRYELSFKPGGMSIKVVKHLVNELKYLRLIRKENGCLILPILTDECENITSLIENRDSNELKRF